MKNGDIAEPDKKTKRRSSPLIAHALMIAAVLVIGNQSFADDSHFRVVYSDVPGVEHLEAGSVERGIQVLEDQLKQSDKAKHSEVWATLCAAHIITLSLSQAEDACNNAVAAGATFAALNNRGVIRAYRGDFEGAREDFDRARPLRLEAYMKELVSNDVRVVAADNYRLINIVLARSGAGGSSAAVARSTAEIEDPSH